MIRISKQSRLNPDEIVAKASLYFGKGGEGLDETERGCCISFAGAGGYVTVTVSEENGRREVDFEFFNQKIEPLKNLMMSGW